MENIDMLGMSLDFVLVFFLTVCIIYMLREER